MDPNGNGKKDVRPLLRELIRRQRQDSDTSTNPAKSSKKKNQPTRSSPETTTGEVLTAAKTQIRKPFHQICLEELSHKSKSSTKMEPDDIQTFPRTSSKPTDVSTISKRIAAKIQQFEHQASAAQKSSFRQAIPKLPFESKLPLCLRGVDPCVCIPKCVKTGLEFPLNTSTKKTSLRSSSNSPPLQRNVKTVRKLFENTSAPSSPVAHSPTSCGTVTKVKDIIKQLVELTEPYASKIASDRQRDRGTSKVDQRNNDIAQVEELCEAFKSLIISPGISKSKPISPSNKQKLPDTWKPISLSDVYKKGSFDPESITLVVKSTSSSTPESSEEPLPLSELYKKANLPCDDQTQPLKRKHLKKKESKNVSLSTSNLDLFETKHPKSTSGLSLPDIYSQGECDVQPVAFSSSPHHTQSHKVMDDSKPLSIGEIYEQVGTSSSTSWAEDITSKSSTAQSQEISLKSNEAGHADYSVSKSSSQMEFSEFGYSLSFPASSQHVALSSPSDCKKELFDPGKDYYSMLESTANYIDLSSYVTSEPKSVRSVSHELDVICSLDNSPVHTNLLVSSSSDDFRSAGVLDLTSYCLSAGDKVIPSPTKESYGAKPKYVKKCEVEKIKISKHSEQRPSTSTSIPEIPKHLRDMFKKLGAIPKRAFQSNVAPRPAVKKSKPPKSTSKFPSKKLKSLQLERIPENQEVSRYKSESSKALKSTSKKSQSIVTSSSKRKKKSSKVLQETVPKNKTASVNKSDTLGVFKYYPVLPDYRPKSVVTKLQLEVACSLSTIPLAEPGNPRLKAGDLKQSPDSEPKMKKKQHSSTSAGPESLPEPPRLKSGEGSSSNSLLKYTFRSPQSGAIYAVEEYGEEEDLPDISLLDDGKSAPRLPRNNDDGLDIIFGPLEGDGDYDCGDYYEEEEEDPFEDTECDMGQDGGEDSPDLEFVYDDADTHGNEIAELYSYTEQPELQYNVKAFEDQMEIYQLPPSWQRLSVEKRRSVVMKLLDQLECSKKPVRMRSARCLLYIAQGCWAEVQSDTEQQHWTRLNALMIFQLGGFSAFTDLLNIEIDNNTAAYVAMRKIAISLIDSQDLRVILSVLYIITEVIRNEKMREDSEYKSEIEAFVFEIGHSHGDDHLVIKLLSMVTRFCSGAAPHFPMKKVLLLLWKVTLVSLGGMNTLKELKAEKRRRAKLPPQDEDTMEIAKTMRSSSPPASASDLLEAQNQKRSNRPFRRSLMKQSSLDDQESLGMEMETSMGNENGDELADMTEYDERRPTDNSETGQMFNNHILNMYNMQVSPPPQHDIVPRGLPWKPKVRQKDIDAFLDASRQKFLGYSLPGDQTTLFGLPEPIHEGVRILKEHVYTSLAELQIQKEEEIARNPVSTKEEEIELTPAEILYQAMLPNLPQYMIALLKILLAAAPTSKAKTDSINIMSDVLPEEMPMTVLQSMKLGIDVNRHKEIIVKAVSAILLLLLKHFKLNHIYQFEFMSQHLVFANCIPLVLKFFNQNIMGYIGAKNVIPILDFPSCVIGDQPELTAESLEIGDAAPFSWRNMFSCINLLRILNKLTKWKHSRIMMLVVFKSAPILKRTLKIRHAMTQLYVLKLLKMQTKYLGRQWRKSNMKTISAIYQKVRHRLNDDWAYGNDLDARPWDFQAEECALRASVDRFNNRRYTQVVDSDFEPVDNNPSSVLGHPHELSESFKRHYSLWLEQEVHGTPIDWEQLLLSIGKEDRDDDKDSNKQ